LLLASAALRFSSSGTWFLFVHWLHRDG
jgi:hypothetical protein